MYLHTTLISFSEEAASTTGMHYIGRRPNFRTAALEQCHFVTDHQPDDEAS